ncbi:hypothetical protein ACIRPS_15245 [Streptomyces griseoviridis]
MTISPDFTEFVPSHAAPAVLNADDIQVRWVVPENFHDLPVRFRDDGEAVQLLEDLTDKVLPGADYDDKTAFGVLCAISVEELTDLGVEYAAVCITVVDDVPCTATLSVFLVDSPEANGTQNAVRDIASNLSRAEAGEVSQIDLPCGSAVSCIGTRSEAVAGDLTGSEESVTFPVGYIRIFLPLPNGTTLLMEMATPTMVGWDIFSTMFGNTVSSIRLYRADGSRLITSQVGG